MHVICICNKNIFVNGFTQMTIRLLARKVIIYLLHNGIEINPLLSEIYNN